MVPSAFCPIKIQHREKAFGCRFLATPAYTTTLVHKLAKHTGATLIMFCCTRRAPGLGYAIQFTPLPPLSDDAASLRPNSIKR